MAALKVEMFYSTGKHSVMAWMVFSSAPKAMFCCVCRMFAEILTLVLVCIFIGLKHIYVSNSRRVILTYTAF